MSGFVSKKQLNETLKEEVQEELTTSDHKLACALANDKTVEEAAVVAGISARTAFRRKCDPAFHLYLNTIRRSYIERFSDKARSHLDKAFDSLFKLTHYEDATALRAIEFMHKVAKNIPTSLETEIPPSIAHGPTTESEQEASPSTDQGSETMSEPESPTSDAKKPKPVPKQEMPLNSPNGKAIPDPTPKEVPKLRRARR